MRSSFLVLLLGSLLTHRTLKAFQRAAFTRLQRESYLLAADRKFDNDSINEAVTEQLASRDVSFVKVYSKEESILRRQQQQQQQHDDFIASIPPDTPAVHTSPAFVTNNLDAGQFGTLFHQCAPYIASHRGKTVVLHINGPILGDTQLLDAVLEDVSILHLLGVQVVLIAGVRELLDIRIQQDPSRTSDFYQDMRITDARTLTDLKELSGLARFEIESSLAKSYSGKPGKSGINVISGNFFYSGKPVGVRDGIDFKFTGEVRKVEVENLNQRLEQGDVVLLTSLAYSPSGEVFNVPSEMLAAEVAAQMAATKLIYWTEGQTVLDQRSDKPQQSLQLRQAEALLERLKAETNTTISKGGIPPGSVANFRRTLEMAVSGLSRGVKRAHLIPPSKGTLLKELYTRDGAGMLINRDVYEGIRQATVEDVRGVEAIIRPLEEAGILVHRSRKQLEADMQHCFVLTIDSAVLACAMLRRYSETHAEISMLAVHPSNRKAGRGEKMLAYLERRCLLMGITHVFILSTRTMQWFEERGFQAADPSSLPPAREYNTSRASKVYMKTLGTQRDVDQEEVLWNIF